MKYKIVIWQWHSKVDTFENDDIGKVLEWYEEEWKMCYERGYCMFDLYENNKIIEFEEEYKMGFYK